MSTAKVEVELQTSVTAQDEEKANGFVEKDVEKNDSPTDKSDEGEDTVIKEDGIYKCLPKFLRFTFADPVMEDLYHTFAARAKRDALQSFALLCLLVDIAGIIVCAVNYTDYKLRALCIVSIGAFVYLVFFILCRFQLLPNFAYKIIPYLLWFIMQIQMYSFIGLVVNIVSPMDLVQIQCVIMYAAFVMLPLRLWLCALLCGLSCIVHTVVVIALSVVQNSGKFVIVNEVFANIFLYICAAFAGIVSFILTEKKLRKSFVETKASLSINLVIEESSKERERLLLSVLPKHVADEMVKDMGEVVGGQFRKIYMSRHENVSILFADIVGFTALSSSVTASELVKILNDLFANFDKLAQKYHQLRIKILGDCYYCISGAPDERSDHAVLSIHMGMAVVKAIEEVREKTKSGVSMRVGIHTGGVLGGVLGQDRWQFDVLGKEVTFANKMESGGVPGRVHISEVTKTFLDDQFELENGEGETREDAIKIAGTKTYLVTSVNQPYPLGTLDEGKGKETDSAEAETNHVEENRENTEKSMKKKMKRAIEEREDSKNIWKMMNMLTLNFKDTTMETEYNTSKRRHSGPALSCAVVVLLCCFCAQLLVLPKNLISILSFVIGEILLIILCLITLASNFRIFPEPLVKFADWTERTPWFRTLWACVIVAIHFSAEFIDLFGCDTSGNYTQTYLDPNSTNCEHPTYFFAFAVLILISVSLLIQINHFVKIVVLLVISLTYSLVTILALPALFDRYDSFLYSSTSGLVPSKFTSTFYLFAVVLALIYFSRYLDLSSRKRFLWRHEAEDQREQINVMREKNEALVYNILPSHVAKDFVGSHRKDEELYSHTYDEVGVIFAACPNFNDFYTEDTVNNNGLECIRFLNEIISDYDDLLKEARFRSITKIKTIGSTYMAASGMTGDINKDSPFKERWQHLAELTDFALAMKDSLDKINAQSFNTFKLRIGINKGPILAGVIGAKKPHYDIWGNSVNVASRMESTGQLGKIQVVEETKEILEQFGFTFEKRGLVKVKGKGELLTYFLTGKEASTEEQTPNNLPNQVAPF